MSESAKQILTIMIAIFVPMIGVVLSGLGWLIKEIFKQKEQLAVIVNEVNPPNRPGLWDALDIIKSDVAQIHTDVAVIQSRNSTKDSLAEPLTSPK